MYTRDVSDRISGISAADLAQRLVEVSARNTARDGALSPSVCQRPLPHCVSALLWDAKCAGAAPPRTALLRGDVVDMTSSVSDATLSCVALSDDVRFRFARSRHRRLTGILSSTAAPLPPRMCRVDVTHFYWMDECAPGLTYDDQSVLSTVLQKRIVQWAVSAFARNPLLRNISLQALEAVFPALLAFSPREREELLKHAAELLGQGTLIWYGQAMIKQFHESAASLALSLLTSSEERCSAALLFALATAQEVMGARRDDAAQALRFLLEVYGVRGVALSPALTTAALLVSRATVPLCTRRCLGAGSRQHHLLQPYLFPLSCAHVETLPWIPHNTHTSSPEHLRELVRRAREAAAAVLATAAPCTATTAQKRHAHEDDVNAFFSANHALEIHRDTLVTHASGDVPSSLPALKAADSGAAARSRLLEAAPKWWEQEAKASNSDTAREETELKLHVKAAAAELREPHGSDHALLAVIHRTRKRQRNREQPTAQTVEAALEGAAIRLKRRAFLQLVDIFALNAHTEDRDGKARQYLEQHHVAEAQIRDFTTLLSSTRKT
ncbi:conserved hypothetical protein [Leishmania major strain Friedlin]|uniref:Uncharacterized protein n=1 Tax=Leishmania major TaxID=5664 RepID=Q4Q280_LEIMA|nr:conserved hypothetical protein [Leishmania major strain Friedlin]CAG9582349.1 hypothetical_protein_-_conserved [Leishmania major strain Friedlin]CAJ08209.1 conserved hypothetical protein [Leishmania major strain Friedlin]|eukprot:XP_001686568.1 conserved hypothetical protein [Leishmania major strain Friedlin]